MAIPEATVTMIGATGCGKSTYMIGMYSVMSSGLAGYYLTAQDLDLDLDLSERWEDMRKEDKFPPANLAEEPVPYPFYFRDEQQTLLTFAWEDYRGGAMSDRGNPADVDRLNKRLLKSDSIYLAIDGEHLLNGVDANNLQDVRPETKANIMAPRLQHVFHECEQRGDDYPSFVILVTKADKIADAHPTASARELLDLVYDSARALLPACFGPGRNTMVCPVQVCRDETDRVTGQQVRKVSARNVHFPLVYSFLHYLNAHTDLLRDDLGRFEAEIDDNDRRLRTLEGKFWAPILRGQELAEMRSRAQSDAKARDERRRDLTTSETKVAALARLVEEAIGDDKVAVCENGVRL